MSTLVQDNWVHSVPDGMEHIEVYFDGGCRPTNPGNKYGSWEVLLNGHSVKKSLREEFGWGTSNESEFDALLAALRWTVHNLGDGGFSLASYGLEAITDSRVVYFRLLPKNKGSGHPVMARLSREVKSITAMFGAFTATWKGRNQNVARFGH